jgi:hypothetical protein
MNCGIHIEKKKEYAADSFPGHMRVTWKGDNCQLQTIEN